MEKALVLIFSGLVFLSGCSFDPNQLSGNAGPQPDAQEPPTTQAQPNTAPAGATQPTAAPQANPKDSALYSALSDAGLENSLVEFQANAVLVSFELPESYDEERTAYYVMGQAASLAEPSQKISVESISGENSKIYSVSADKVQKFIIGEITEAEFAGAVQIS